VSDRLEEIADPWPAPEEEYRALADLIVPAAQQRLVVGLQDWDAIDTKALGVLATAVALAALAALHHTLNALWWLPAVGLGIACLLLAAVIWPYDVESAPDLLELHDEMRNDGALRTARELLSDLTAAADGNDSPLDRKITLFGYALIVLGVSLAACLPILIIRPGVT
jgi:hypothetical protein